LRLKYITIERADRTKEDVLRKIRRELGRPMRLFSYAPLIQLTGNSRILELKPNMREDFLIKVDGPEFLLKEIKEHFNNGGNV